MFPWQPYMKKSKNSKQLISKLKNYNYWTKKPTKSSALAKYVVNFNYSRFKRNVKCPNTIQLISFLKSKNQLLSPLDALK